MAKKKPAKKKVAGKTASKKAHAKRPAKMGGRATPVLHHHKDGTLWAKGQSIGGVMTGYWEWYRKDGSKMRSGHFENGEQVGEWTTYASDGRVVKVTLMKRKKQA